jgi:hypothetical protein
MPALALPFVAIGPHRARLKKRGPVKWGLFGVGAPAKSLPMLFNSNGFWVMSQDTLRLAVLVICAIVAGAVCFIRYIWDMAIVYMAACNPESAGIWTTLIFPIREPGFPEDTGAAHRPRRNRSIDFASSALPRWHHSRSCESVDKAIEVTTMRLTSQTIFNSPQHPRGTVQ